MADYCHQADQECTNPPGYQVGSGAGRNPDPPRIRSRCLDCGEPVCRNCSIRRRTLTGPLVRDRVCHSCIERRDGNSNAVMRHIYRLVGEPLAPSMEGQGGKESNG